MTCSWAFSLKSCFSALERVSSHPCPPPPGPSPPPASPAPWPLPHQPPPDGHLNLMQVRVALRGLMAQAERAGPCGRRPEDLVQPSSSCSRTTSCDCQGSGVTAARSPASSRPPCSPRSPSSQAAGPAGPRKRPERGFGGLGVGAGASQPHTAENGLGGRAMSASPRPHRPFPAPRPALLQGLALGTCLHTRLRGDSSRSSVWRPHCVPPPTSGGCPKTMMRTVSPKAL